MHRIRWARALGLLVLGLALASCAAYTTVGGSTQHVHSGNSGWLEMSHNKANGTTELDLADDIPELDGAVDIGDVLDVNLTLAVGKGSFKIELLGRDKQVTLALEARDGQTVSGQGQIVVDSFGDVPYRVTATQAENVDYYMEYTIQ